MDIRMLSLASALAAHAAARQEVLAENVAQADTPGYRARDLEAFAAHLGDPHGFAARTTRPGHVAFGGPGRAPEPRAETVLGAEAPNGNTVSLEDQMMRAAAVRQDHALAVGVYAKALEILRTATVRR